MDRFSYFAQAPNQGERLPPIRTVLQDLPPTDLMPALQGYAGHAMRITDVYYPNETSSSSSNVPSPTMTDSDSSTVYTPASSRRPSMATALNRSRGRRSRNGSRAMRVNRPFSPAMTDEPLQKCEQCGKTNCAHIVKAKKERANRKNQGARLQDLEDIFQNYLGLGTDRLQSPGNHNAAGLDITKIGILDHAVACFSAMIQDGYVRALQDGRLKEWQRDTVNGITAKLSEGHPLAGTWLLEDPHDQLCDHDRHSKVCTVHGNEDWCQCRKLRRQRYFSSRRDQARRGGSLQSPRPAHK